MCGIVGHVTGQLGERSIEVVMGGLGRLEYRGYDSGGVATHAGTELQITKKVGKLAQLTKALAENPHQRALAGIGHTRWATHGAPSDINSHPHTSADGRLAIVHNGIIENASQYRAHLAAHGAVFKSDTDTEVVAHLLAKAYDADASETDVITTPNTALSSVDADLPPAASAAGARLARALWHLRADLEGTFTILAMHADAPGVVVAARRSSPLVIGLGEGENYLGSDVLAFVENSDQAVEIGQDELVVVTPAGALVIDNSGKEVLRTRGLELISAPEYQKRGYVVDFAADRACKDGWPTFMEKEIWEQPRGVAETLEGRTDADGYLTLDELRIPAATLRAIDKIVVVACGTASYAGQVARYAIEHWCRIPVEVELAHEFRYRDPVVSEKTLVVAISQSGETMDTIMAVRHAREQGAKVLAIVNTPGSTISRESDAVLITKAGPEIAVASTKAFTAQVAACYLLGLYLAQVRGNKYVDEIADYLEKLNEIPAKIQQVLDRSESVRQVARAMANEKSVIFLGRHVGFPIAMEGALKLKEIAYIHAEGFAAGELKHGPIALIEPGQPVFIIVPTPRRPELHRKVVSNIQEVRARGARTLVVAEDGDTSVDEYAEVVFRVPTAPTLMKPLLAVVPLQIFACELAAAKGLDVDQPRNLAKSVTVE